MVKKTVFTLNVGDYEPEITALTYPFMRQYANRIGADFHVITDRKFPEWPVTYEKLQIYQLGRGNDWNIYIDSDALVHPSLFLDVTQHLSRDTVFQCVYTAASMMFRPDRYFDRDGRGIGSCSWFTVASDWCMDLWRPLDDLTPEEAVANILPFPVEGCFGAKPEHIADDYALSRNIAKYGLKFKGYVALQRELLRLKALRLEGILPAATSGPPVLSSLGPPVVLSSAWLEQKDERNYLWHIAVLPREVKLYKIQQQIAAWQQPRGLKRFFLGAVPAQQPAEQVSPAVQPAPSVATLEAAPRKHA